MSASRAIALSQISDARRVRVAIRCRSDAPCTGRLVGAVARSDGRRGKHEPYRCPDHGYRAVDQLRVQP